MDQLPPPLTTALYTVAETAALVGTPRNTLRSWARSYDYTTRTGQVRHSDPLVTDAGAASRCSMGAWSK